MSTYGNIMGQALAQASLEASEKGQDAEPNGAADDVKMASNPDYKPQGEVMIEIPMELRDSDELKNLRASLESKGWTTHVRERIAYSAEDTSTGETTGRPIPSEDDVIVNAVVNGVANVYEKDDLYRVVQLVRPEDTIVDGSSDIIYLMNDNGDVKDYLRNEGKLVTDDIDALDRMLLTDNEKSI